jgi:hypothetical protein
MNGRTYCGHYNGYYLKSTLEYIYAHLLTPFYEQVRVQFDIQDERTLSKALLGRQTNRKEMLGYFRHLVENVLGATGK